NRSALACAKVGADDQNRTGDLVLTKDALCQLSYIGLPPPRLRRFGGTGRWPPGAGLPSRSSPRMIHAASEGCPPSRPRRFGETSRRSARLTPAGRRMERETGIEPATNSLEGCDSTTELLPPISLYPSNLRSFALARDLASRLPLRSRQPVSETSAAKAASHYDSKRHD